MADKHEVAQWLIDEIETNGQTPTYHSTVIFQIRERFGDEWLYINANGNPAIHKDVVKEFAKLKNEFVHWDRSAYGWRILTPEQLDAKRDHAADKKARKAQNAALDAARNATFRRI